MKTYKVIGLTALICIILTSSLWYVFGATPTSTIYISSGIYPTTPSYVIWKEGSSYFSKNHNGEIVYSGTNASLISQQTITAVQTTGNKHILFKGNITLTHPLDLTQTRDIMIEGDGGFLIISNTGLNAMFDLTGAYHISFVNINFYVPSTSTLNTLFLLARDSGAYSSGAHVFDNVQIYDYGTTVASIYSYASEVNRYRKVDIYVRKTAFIITQYNIESLSSDFVTIASGSQSCLQTLFVDGSILSYFWELTGGNTTKVRFDGGGNHVFKNSYFGSFYSYLFKFELDNDGFYGIWFEGNRVEGKFMEGEVSGTYRNINGITLQGNWFDYGGVPAGYKNTNYTNFYYANNALNSAFFKENLFSTTATYNFTAWQVVNSFIDFRGCGEANPYLKVGNVYYSTIYHIDTSFYSISGGYNNESYTPVRIEADQT